MPTTGRCRASACGWWRRCARAGPTPPSCSTRATCITSTSRGRSAWCCPRSRTATSRAAAAAPLSASIPLPTPMPTAASSSSSGATSGRTRAAAMDASVEFVKELLPSIVNVHTTIPRAHPSTRILGEERMGSGVVVDASGLLLTVNYVVMGASTIEVAPLKGRRTRAEVVAQDYEIGLALIRTKRQGFTPAPMATAAAPERGDPVVAIASSGVHEVRVAGGLVTYLGEFEAYWEYLLDRGIVSSAPNPGNGGGG